MRLEHLPKVSLVFANANDEDFKRIPGLRLWMPD